MRRSLLGTLTLITLLAGATAQAGINKWTTLGPEGGGGIYRVELPASAPNVAYAIATSGFYHSSDNGAHWVQNEDDLTPLALDFAVDPTDPLRVYVAVTNLPGRLLVSTNGGAAFSTLRVFDQLEPAVAIVTSSDGKTLYTVGWRQVFQSKDRGQTWQQRTSIPDIGIAYRGVHIDSADARTLYVARGTKLLVTHDEGVTWADIAPAQITLLEDLTLDPSDSRRLWVAGAGGLYFSPDGGVSWSRKDTDWHTSVALDPRAPSTVYTGIFGGTLRKGDGTTFSDITANIGPFHPQAITVSPHDSGTIFVANARGLWFTNNGGTSWQPRNGGLGAVAVGRFHASPARGRTYVVGNLSGQIDDGSDVITTFHEDALFQTLNFQSGGVGPLVPVFETGAVIAALGDRMARSFDDGKTWTQLPYTPEPHDAIYDLAATTSGASIYYASSAFTLKRSIDQGATWQSGAAGLPTDKSPGLLAIAPSDPSILYAGPCDHNGCIFEGAGVYKSVNGGDSWTAANAGIEDARVRSFAIHPTQPNIVYAATSKGLLKTVDGGTTWTPLSWIGSQNSFADPNVALDPAHPNVVYAVGSGSTVEIARSDDGGQTWFHIATGPYAVPFFPTAVSVDPGRENTIRVGSGAGVKQISLRPDVAIEVSDLAADLSVGMRTPYAVTVRNAGHLRSTNIGVELQLPAGTTEIEANASTGTCAVAGATITCTAPLLIDSITITGRATPMRAGPFAIVAAVHGDQTEIDTTNNAVTRTSAANVRADLGFYATATVTGVAGSAMQLNLSFINGGPSPTTGVRVTSQIPAGLVVNSFKINGGGTCTKPQADRLVCDVPALAWQETISLDMSATAAAAGTYEIVSAVSSDGMDPDSSLNTRTQTMVVSAAPAPPTPPAVNNGDGGGGGALSPLFVLGLLGFALSAASARGRCPSRQTTRD